MMPLVDHAREIRSRLADPIALASALGLSDGAKRQTRGLMVSCPKHIERTPSCSIRVGGDGTVAVRCHGCGWTGDALSLVAAVRGLDIQRDFRRVLEEAANLAGYDLPAQQQQAQAPPPPRKPPTCKPPERIPAGELTAFWAATGAVNRTDDDPHELDMGVAWYLARRAWFPPDLAALDLVRVTALPHTYPWPRWWPASWAQSYRLVTRAYDAAGNFVSVHARSIDPAASPKTRWPRGYPAGHLFADRRGAALLRGDFSDVDRVVIVEGFSDLVATSLAIYDARRTHAVIGITSGSTRALRDVKWSCVPVIVATDHDVAGERYAAEITAALPKYVEWRRTQPISKPAGAR